MTQISNTVDLEPEIPSRTFSFHFSLSQPTSLSPYYLLIGLRLMSYICVIAASLSWSVALYLCDVIRGKNNPSSINRIKMAALCSFYYSLGLCKCYKNNVEFWSSPCVRYTKAWLVPRFKFSTFHKVSFGTLDISVIGDISTYICHCLDF